MRRRTRALLMIGLCVIFLFGDKPLRTAALEEGKGAQEICIMYKEVFGEDFTLDQIKGINKQGMYVLEGQLLQFYHFGNQELRDCILLPETAEYRFFASQEQFFVLLLEEGVLSICRCDGAAENIYELAEGISALPEGFVTSNNEWIYLRSRRMPAAHRRFVRAEDEVMRLRLEDMQELPVRKIHYVLREDGENFGRRITALGGNSDNIYLLFRSGRGVYDRDADSGILEKLEYRTSYEKPERILERRFAEVPDFVAGNQDYCLLPENTDFASEATLKLYHLTETEFKMKLALETLPETEKFEWSMVRGEEIYVGNDKSLLLIESGEETAAALLTELPGRPFLTTKGAVYPFIDGERLCIRPLSPLEEAGR